jgi:hypothetical protein
MPVISSFQNCGALDASTDQVLFVSAKRRPWCSWRGPRRASVGRPQTQQNEGGDRHEISTVCLVPILLSILVLPLSALAVPLSDLINSGASITEGDKVFFNFSGTLSGSGFASPLDLSGVDVSATTVNGAQTLFIGGPFSVVSRLQQDAVLDLLVGFDVTVTGPSLFIDALLVLPRSRLTGNSRLHHPGGSKLHAEGTPPEEVAAFIAGFSFRASPPENWLIGLSMSTFGFPASVVTEGFYLALSTQSVPEPSTVLLLVFGAVLITAMALKICQA